ncbi:MULTISPECIES: protein sip-5 [Stenotrophomonas]|uniref:protein sip-5 n=1 Tax=Stenotrophomonas TaxID=40323 RepID=UPI000D53FB06|nr:MULTISPECIES: protein sip-5 [Stenotrophomonas]AWH23898.1 protein sip-5 [Stenotrophomonas sp. YAU14D1_LEIMI4_1]
MKFGALQRRVKRCEQVVAVRMAETQDNWGVLSQVWRRGWSPLRIVVVGLAGGFVAGKLEVPGKVNGARWLQMIGSVSNLMASGQAAFAAAMAAHAADTADEAAETADAAADTAADTAAGQATPPPASAPAAPRAADELRVPQPAEAATDVSER